MPVSSNKTTKLYYRIGEVAQMFDVNVSLIRFYENEFTIIKPFRNKKGNRLFTQADIDTFHKIFYYIKEKGYTLEGVKQKLKEEKSLINISDGDVMQALMHMKRFLLDLRKQLDVNEN